MIAAPLFATGLAVVKEPPMRFAMIPAGQELALKHRQFFEDDRLKVSGPARWLVVSERGDLIQRRRLEGLLDALALLFGGDPLKSIGVTVRPAPRNSARPATPSGLVSSPRRPINSKR